MSTATAGKMPDRAAALSICSETAVCHLAGATLVLAIAGVAAADEQWRQWALLALLFTALSADTDRRQPNCGASIPRLSCRAE